MRKLKKLRIDYSSLAAYRECPRKFLLGTVHNLTPKDAYKEESATLIGGLIHKAIDDIYLGLPWKERFFNGIPKDSYMYNLDNGRAGSVSHVLGIIEAYIARYSPPDDRDFKVLHSEKRLEVEIAPWLTLTGNVDKVAIMKDTGKYVIIDHKTSKSMDRFLIKQIPVNDQFIGYSYLASKCGFPTKTILVDAISTAVKDVGGDNMFHRELFTYTQETIDEWLDRLLKVCARIKEDLELDDFATNQPAACGSYAGCKFLNVCSQTLSTRKLMLLNAYTSGEVWDSFSVEWEK